MPLRRQLGVSVVPHSTHTHVVAAPHLARFASGTAVSVELRLSVTRRGVTIEAATFV